MEETIWVKTSGFDGSKYCKEAKPIWQHTQGKAKPHITQGSQKGLSEEVTLPWDLKDKEEWHLSAQAEVHF